MLDGEHVTVIDSYLWRLFFGNVGSYVHYIVHSTYINRHSFRLKLNKMKSTRIFQVMCNSGSDVKLPHWGPFSRADSRWTHGTARIVGRWYLNDRNKYGTS